MSKTAYKTIAQSLILERLKDFDLPTERVDHRRLSVDEIKAIVKEEFGKAKEASDVKAKEVEGGWGDAEIENEIDWVKKLKLKEFFNKKESK